MTPLATTSREILVINANRGAPIACDMTGASDTPQDRLAEYGRLFGAALVDRQRSGEAIEFRFALRAGIADWIVDLVRREAACCPFFSYRVSVEGDRSIWRTSSEAGAEAQAMLDEFHDLPEHSAEGIDGYFERVASKPGLLGGQKKSSCGC